MKRSASELALEEFLKKAAVISPEVTDADDDVFNLEQEEEVIRSPKRGKNFLDSADSACFFGDIDFSYFLAKNNRVRSNKIILILLFIYLF